MILRPYQKEALDSIISSYESGITSQLIVLPTGSGKTVIMAAVLKHFKKKSALVVAHRKEIISQTMKTMTSFIGEDVGTYMSKQKDTGHRVVVGMIQSCARSSIRTAILDKKFDILIVDEAHHSAAKTYRRLIDGLSAKLLLGFTATPSLSNGNTLGEVYQNISYSKQIKELIDLDHLSDVSGRKIRIKIGLDGVSVSNGDFVQWGLSKVMNTPSVNNIIASKYKKYIKDGKSVAFCVDVNHAKSLSKAFNKAGTKSGFIHGLMNAKCRRKVINDLKDGSIEVLTSVGVLTEGFDMPEINTIVMARPTKSRSLYIQMVGRGLRKSKNKQRCMVLDFSDEDHKLKQVMSLGIVIPHAKINVDIINGDSSRIPGIEEEIDASFLKILDEELDLLDVKLNNKKVEVVVPKDAINQKRALESIVKKLEKGEIIGQTPFGYKNIAVGRRAGYVVHEVVVDEEAAQAVKFAFNEYAYTELSMALVAEKTNKKFGLNKTKSGWSHSLSNLFYVGIQKSKLFGCFAHKYERIISAQLFSDVKKKKLSGRYGKGYKNTSHDHTYKAAITCYHCGCILFPDIKKKKYTYYKCTEYRWKHKAKTLTEVKINEYFKDVFSNMNITKDNMFVISNYLKERDGRFKEMKDKDLNREIYKLRNRLGDFFLGLSGQNKRNVLRAVFKKIQCKDDKLIHELNKPFDKLFIKE